MKKILLFLFFVSVAFVVNAQVLRPSGLPTTNSPSRYDVTGYQRDSAFLYVLRDSFPAKYPSVIYHPNGNLYKTDGGTGAHWSLITDTTWLSYRIDLKLNIADTAAMLSNYLRETDTANLVAPYIKYSDTSNMLTPYHQSFYTATFDTTTRILTMYPIAGTVPTILSIPRGGSISGISSLTPYRVPGSDVQYLIADNGDAPGFTLKTADSATIMHYSDTATMLAPYAHSQAVVKYYDTSGMLSKYVRYTDTANIVANRLKISDTATMLANRLKISDTASMLAGYKTYYPRTAISGGTGITYDPTTGVISNGSPSSGGTVTIVSAGVGMNFTTITTTGSVNADTLILATRLHIDSVAMRKLNLTDTSTMLSSRLKISDTATMLRNHATYAETLSGKNISGSTNNLSNIGNSSLINSTISGIPLGSNLSALTNGFGITTLSYNGSTAKVVTVDTSSSGVATWALLKKKIDSVSAIGGGSVSSVGLVLPSFITVSGSPITTSGTLTGTLANQTANLVFASPTTGSPAQPTFRALVAADLPDLSGTYIKNQTTEQSSSNFNISGTGVMAVSMGVGTTSSPVSSQQINTSSPISTLSNSTTTVMQNLLLGALNFYSNDNSVTSTGGVGAIMVKSASDYNSSFTPSYMTFSIHDTSANNSTVLGTITEVMRLNESKKVLILDSVDNRRDVLQVNGNAQFTSLTPTVTLSYNSSTISANDLIASFNAYSKDASVTSSGGVGGLRVYAEQDFNSGNTPSYVTVSTHDNTPNDSTQLGNVLERLRINADGTYKFTSYPTAGFVKTSSDGTVSIDAGSYITPTDTAAMLSHYAYKDLTNTSFYDSIAALRSLANSKYTGGTLTSVDMSVPIGLSISGNPITTSGTLAVSLTSGYQIPTTNNPSFTGTAASLNIGGTAATATALVNSVTFNNGGSGDASGTTFDGSVARIISYNSVGASPLAGSSSLVTTGALTSGSIGSGFGSINIGSNSLTAGAISGTTGAFSSQILSTVGNNSRYLYNGTATTGYIYQQLWNTGGNMLLGLDASTGGALATGAPAYSTVLTTATATALAFGINQVIKYTIDASGNNTWTGSGEFGSTLTASSLQTDAPSGSTARLWKLGDYTAGTLIQNGYVAVDINGVVYYLLTGVGTNPEAKILNKDNPIKLTQTIPKKPKP